MSRSAPQPVAGALAVNADAAGEIPFAEEGTPEWRLYEITRLLAPPATQKEVVSADGTRQLVERSPEEIAFDRKEHLRQLTSHAGQIIAATHADPAQETLFTNAVRYLASAHVELALLGDADSARKLSEVAESLFAAKPQSTAAAEAAAHIVELARGMAERYGQADAEWVRAQATQARLFASRFPLETSRCVAVLLDAGRACERAQLGVEARACYLQLADTFGDSPFATAVAPILRRLNLEGQTLAAEDFGGPAIDGGFVSISEYRGRPVLIVFWSSDSPTFERDFAQLQAIQQSQGDKLAIIGVNLDVDESAVERFLETHSLNWRQVFDSDPGRRGTQNPIAAHYGVTTVPLYWLVDAAGRVTAATADLSRLGL